MAIRTLLVDDEKAIREIFSMMLNGEGFDVQVACNAAEAVARLASEEFDLVVTDMRMETALAGYEVVRQARMHREAAIVVMTAYPMQATDYLHAGADALIVKGMNTGELAGRLREVIAARGKLKPAADERGRRKRRA